MESEIDINGDTELLQLLSDADPADVSVLVDFLTDSGKGRLSMASEVRAALESAKRKSKFSRGVLLLLIRELQHYGGNSIVNLFRRNGVPYAEIVADVLSHVGGTSSKDEPAASPNSRCWRNCSLRPGEDVAARTGRFLQGLPERHRCAGHIVRRDSGSHTARRACRRTGRASGKQCVRPVGNGRGFGRWCQHHRGACSRVGIWPCGGGADGYCRGSHTGEPAYRVTVPCVVQIAYIRQKNAQVTCPACHAGSVRGTKFCSECGTALVQ